MSCFFLAEMEGFEPPHALRRLPDFESGPFSHLGTSPSNPICPPHRRSNPNSVGTALAIMTYFHGYCKRNTCAAKEHSIE